MHACACACACVLVCLCALYVALCTPHVSPLASPISTLPSPLLPSPLRTSHYLVLTAPCLPRTYHLRTSDRWTRPGLSQRTPTRLWSLRRHWRWKSPRWARRRRPRRQLTHACVHSGTHASTCVACTRCTCTCTRAGLSTTYSSLPNTCCYLLRSYLLRRRPSTTTRYV